MNQPQVSPRVTTHPHLAFSAIATGGNDLGFNDYFLEPRKPTPQKGAQETGKEPLKRPNQNVPVLKGFHKVSKTEDISSPGYLFNSERGKQIIKMNFVNKEEAFSKPIKVLKFQRHPHKSHSTKVMPTATEDSAKLNQGKSLNEIITELEAKENEIKKLQQTNQKMKKDINVYSSRVQDPEAKKVFEKLQKYEKIIKIYSKLLDSCSSSMSSRSEYQIIDTATLPDLPKTERKKPVIRQTKRGSLEMNPKDSSDLYYNEAGSVENLTYTAPDLTCLRLQTKTSLQLNCETPGNGETLHVELQTPTSLSGFYSARDDTRKPGKVKRNFVLRRCESKSKVKFNLTTVSSFDNAEEKTIIKSGYPNILPRPDSKKNVVDNGEQQLNRKNSSMENTRDTIKNEKNSFIGQELNGIADKLTRIMTIYQLEEEKMMKKTEEIIKKIEILKSNKDSKPIF